MDIYLYDDYKTYLIGYIQSLPRQGHGARLQLAETLGCQTSFISQVLRGDLHFSLEQAEMVSQFCNHTKEETYYYLLLVQAGRAGTARLKSFLETKLRELRTEALQVKNRTDAKEELDPNDQAHYYSSWMYSAIHIALTIPNCNNAAALAKSLHVSIESVNEALTFLTRVGLAIKKGANYEAHFKRIHLGNNAQLTRQQHINWRVKTIANLEQNIENENLHYSSVVSITFEDAERIKNDLLKAIVQAKEKIKVSKEETLYSFSLDFYSLINKT